MFTRVAGAVMLGLAVGAGAPYQVRLRPGMCHGMAPGRLASLGAGWRALGAYVQECPVRGPEGRVALTAVVVRIDRMYRAYYFNTRSMVDIPNPVLLDGTDRMVGTLPEGFPTDPPGKLRVTFKDWRGGVPWRIELYEAGESALSPHGLAPQVWAPGDRWFRTVPDGP